MPDWPFSRSAFIFWLYLSNITRALACRTDLFVKYAQNRLKMQVNCLLTSKTLMKQNTDITVVLRSSQDSRNDVNHARNPVHMMTHGTPEHLDSWILSESFLYKSFDLNLYLFISWAMPQSLYQMGTH